MAVATAFTVVFYKRYIAEGHSRVGGFTLVEAVVAIGLIGVGVAATLGALTKFNSIAAISRNATGASAVLMNQVDLFQTMSPFNPQKNLSGVDPCGGATPPPQVPKDYCNTPPSYNMTNWVTSAPGVPGVSVTHVLGYKDPVTLQVIDPCSRSVDNQDTWPVYREPARWEYADAAARTGATGFVATDLGQLAYQRDNQKYYRLATTAPTWTLDDTGGIIVKGTMTSKVTDISPTPNSPPYIYQAVFTIGYQYLGRGPITNTNYKPCGSRAAVTRSEYQQTMTVIRTSDI